MVGEARLLDSLQYIGSMCYKLKRMVQRVVEVVVGDA